jgi:hypothetical protein
VGEHVPRSKSLNRPVIACEGSVSENGLLKWRGRKLERECPDEKVAADFLVGRLDLAGAVGRVDKSGQAQTVGGYVQKVFRGQDVAPVMF